jgi:uncharacterized protein (TIGR02594 family)
MQPLKAYGIPETTNALPRVVQMILPLLGTQEVIGTRNNKTILAWRDEMNAAFGIDPNAVKIAGYSADSIPWCGLFQAYVWFKAGKPCVKDPLWARNWANAGEAVLERVGGNLVAFKERKASLGDTLVFVRDGGGHVGTYICEDATHYGVAGGNQGDTVSIMRLEKSRCIAVRRPPMKAPPASVRPIVVARVPAKTSVNEA